MIPRASEGIGHIVTRIALDLIPKGLDAYATSDLAFLTALLTMIGQDYDRAADVLESEHPQICALLRRAGDLVADPALESRIAEALAVKAASLRIPDLNARADVQLAVLIDVHAAVEEAKAAGAPWAAALDADIWAFLDTFAANRAYEVAF
jgi:hypothetical protein